MDAFVTPEVVERIQTAFPTLSSVRLSYTYRPASFFFYTVVRVSSAHTLRRLCITAHQNHDSSFLSRLLREAMVLEELYLDLEAILQRVPGINFSTGWDPLYFAKSQSLQKLFLPVCVLYRHHNEAFGAIISLFSSLSKSSSLRTLGLPLNIVPIFHGDEDNNAEDNEEEDFESTCFRIFETGLDFSRFARVLRDRLELEEVAIGVITKSAQGKDIDFNNLLGFIDRIHDILRGRIDPMVPERIRVRIQSFAQEEF